MTQKITQHASSPARPNDRVVAPPYPGSPRALLARLFDAPNLVQTIQALPPSSFSALVREIGVEDAGEVLALATTEQLVGAFDEDLFSNVAPGERETFDHKRFALWIEVLLESGERQLAARFAELSEDFAVLALSSLVWVFDEGALRDRFSEAGDEAELADKALESSLSEEIDGYLLVAREPEGWDAVLSLILALDRDNRSLLVRLLDRCVDLTSPLLDDLDDLAERLSASESIAEDVEAEREARRAASGHVEPRAAKSFLTLAKVPILGSAATAERDPITRAYFRDIASRPGPAPSAIPALPALPAGAEQPPGLALWAPLRELESADPALLRERLDEMAYLVNVLVAAGSTKQGRMSIPEAIEVAMATVLKGAILESGAASPSRAQIAATLRAASADRLFRRAVSSAGGVKTVGAVGPYKALPEARAGVRRSKKAGRNPAPARSSACR